MCLFVSQYFNQFSFVLVKKRIDRTQSRLDKLSNQELLLEAAHALRIEKDRQKELDSQLETQKQDIQRSATVIKMKFCCNWKSGWENNQSYLLEQIKSENKMYFR